VTDWTDYNAHDPGVTVLELLAYGIAALGVYGYLRRRRRRRS